MKTYRLLILCLISSSAHATTRALMENLAATGNSFYMSTSSYTVIGSTVQASTATLTVNGNISATCIKFSDGFQCLKTSTGTFTSITVDSATVNQLIGNGAAAGNAYDLRIKPTTDSSTAIQIRQADNTQFVMFDTTNRRVGILTATPAATLEVNGTIKADNGINMNTTTVFNLGNASAATEAAAYGQVIHLQDTLQSGATFFVSSGTASSFNSSSATITSFTASSATITHLIGTTTNDAATIGTVGEDIQSTASGVSLISGQYVDLTSISLTAGDWDIVGLFTVQPQNVGNTFTRVRFSITDTAGNNQTNATDGINLIDGFLPSAASQTGGGAIPSWRVSLSATTIYYLKMQATWTTSTVNGGGRLEARRVR